MSPIPSKLLLLLFILLIPWSACESHKTSNQQETSNQKTATKPKDTRSSDQLVLFFGNSLTAGYGVEPESAFPHLIQEIIDSLSLPYQVINAGLSGETTASGVNRIEWVLREPVDIMILELGGNDGLRGIDPLESKKNLQRIIDLAQNQQPGIRIIIAGMEAPPNMGPDYIKKFRAIFTELAESNDLPLIPFLLAGVGGEPHLNLPDGIHPNEQGHKLVANNVWAVLESEL